MGDQKIPEVGTMLIGRHAVQGSQLVGQFVKTFGTTGRAYEVTALNGRRAVMNAYSAIEYDVTRDSDVAAAVRVLVDAGIDSAAKFDQLIAAVA